ncbi:MAG TPA: GAF and ANTAR domain-containing protein [Galbitalea sp.]|jgi:transcriptional regulator with GAF, ATPase, and Fis domain|nr:GAF and ANTAR domain-containing protein [Galbitalea sp.]
MARVSHDARLVETFATLADTLVAGYDVVELLQTLVERCVDLLDVDAAGILLADEFGELEVVASTSEASRLVEIMQLSAEAGPCIESYRTGAVISVPDIAQSPPQWKQFRRGAREQGFAAAFSIPLRLRETTIGALNLLGATVGQLRDQDIRAAQALADVATIGVLHERTLRESGAIRDQLSNALNSRVIIEQAKGVIAQLHSTSVEEAFNLLRSYARSNRRGLSEVAADVVARKVSI